MAELTYDERQSLLTNDLAYDNMHSPWAQDWLFAAVEQILAAREAALLERLGDERVMEAARREFMRVNYPSPCDKAAMTAALAAVRAELLRQGGGE